MGNNHYEEARSDAPIELAKLLLLRDLSCKITNSGISAGLNFLHDRMKNPRFKRVLGTIPSPFPFSPNLEKDLLHDEHLIEILEQSIAEVEAGLYADHPKLEVLQSLVSTEVQELEAELSPEHFLKVILLI